MEHLKVFRQGKGTFTEWRFESGQPLGRILNQGEGVFLEREFSSLEEARTFCEKELEKNASLIFYVMRGKDIADATPQITRPGQGDEAPPLFPASHGNTCGRNLRHWPVGRHLLQRGTGQTEEERAVRRVELRRWGR